MSSSLPAGFEQARIPLELAEGPLRPVNRDIVQLDIPRDPEVLRLWPGAGDNVLEVLSIDAALCQLVLSIREPSRPYEERVRIREGRVTREQVEAFVRESGGGRVLRPRGSSWLVERLTEPAERRFLVGYDERHLFAAQIPSGTTVREAHEALKPDEVRRAEERWPGRTVRQGEWFFVPATDREIAEVRHHQALHRHRSWHGPLHAGGRPHWVEFRTDLPDGHDPVSGQPKLRSYVRGKVWHPDHRTVCFDRWRRVHLNAAVRRRSQLARGFYWID